MLEFLKALVEKLRVGILLASLAIAILLFKLIGFDAWWMIFAFCVAYLVIVGIEKLAARIKKNNTEREHNKYRADEARQQEERIKEGAWKRFYALDDRGLLLLQRIYLADKDPNNPRIRYVRDNGTVTYTIYNSDDFKIQVGDRTYYPLLSAECIANTSVVTFHPYYYELVAHFIATGKKERV